MSFKSTLLALVALIGLNTTVMAGDYKHSTPAVQGYDVVSYQTGKRPIRGNGNYLAVHDGATYLFSSKANQETFEANPGKFVPAYNGYCAFGVSVGKKFVGDPEVWRVVDGRLYLNLDAGIQDSWLKDVPGRIATADSKWQKIKNKSPASL
ncbi:MAG: YHS domain protein [Pseudomonadales bacterium]|nr:YHS domain protein [Pseudomonadales bacterium]